MNGKEQFFPQENRTYIQTTLGKYKFVFSKNSKYEFSITYFIQTTQTYLLF